MEYSALTIRFITSFRLDSYENMLFAKIVGIVKDRIELKIQFIINQL